MALSDIARRAESTANRVGSAHKRKRGWTPQVTGFHGYGSSRRVHVLGRVLLQNPEERLRINHRLAQEAQRGWRQFFTYQVSGHPVTVTAGEVTVQAKSNWNGYIDVIVEDHGLEPGWHDVTITAEGAQPVTAKVLIVRDDARVGLISDVDDTVIVTMLPRALLAAYNSWVRKTNNRKPVPGMTEFYQEMLAGHPNAPVFYLSTGAWNTFETLDGFLDEHGLPAGPLLLTDWGPTPTGLFRSGQEHKKVQLRNLMIEYPDIQWILVGDDGQHDPLIYNEAVFDHPDRIAGVAFRRLTPSEQLLAHGSTVAYAAATSDVPVVTGADGHELLRNYRKAPFDLPQDN